MDTKVQIKAVEDSRKWKEASSARLFKMTSAQRIKALNEGIDEKLKKLSGSKMPVNH